MRSGAYWRPDRRRRRLSDRAAFGDGRICSASRADAGRASDRRRRRDGQGVERRARDRRGEPRFRPAAWFRTAPMPSFRSKTCASTGNRICRRNGDSRRAKNVSRAPATCDAASDPRAGPAARAARSRRARDGGCRRGAGLSPAGHRHDFERRRVGRPGVTPASRRNPRFESLRHRGLAAHDGRSAAPLSDRLRRGAGVRSGAERRRWPTAMRSCSRAAPRSASAIARRRRWRRSGRPGSSSTGCGSSRESRPSWRGRERSRSSGCPAIPTSALMIFEAVAAPIVAALCRRAAARLLACSFGQPARGRADWTWYVPVACRMMEGLRWRIHFPCARRR